MLTKQRLPSLSNEGMSNENCRVPASRTPARGGRAEGLQGTTGPSSFEAHLAEAQVTRTLGNASPAGKFGQPDFANITKAEYVARGNSKFEQGEITLDDLFQIQLAGGDFDGSVSSDTGKHDFVVFFRRPDRERNQSASGVGSAVNAPRVSSRFGIDVAGQSRMTVEAERKREKTVRNTPRIRRSGRIVATLLLAIAFGGCASMDGVATSVLAERKVEHVVTGKGAPAVVFENGLGGRLEWWAKVLPDIATETTVFAYNRPGIGASAPATTPRDGVTIVEELRATLRAKEIAPPYVLVGHSIGGLYVQLYARRHPDEVAGLVLVDSTHPEQLSGAGAREQWPVLVKLVVDVASPEVAHEELNALPATGTALLDLPPFTGKPVTILSAAKPMSESSELARDSNAKRIDILRLNPGARQVWVDSGHAIPLEKPEAVVTAIREILSTLRRRDR
jgi:pimeloyl-ACP methyl ester carboxylesterase